MELTGEVNKYGWEVPKETIKFSYYYAGDNTLDQAEEDERLQQVADVLKDEFNVEIERIVYKQDATERLNLMLAGDEYPDVIVGMPDDMAEARVMNGSASVVGICAALPQMRVMAAVSPMARPRPKMMAVITPEPAAGNMVRKMARSLVAPRAMVPS